MEQFLTPDEAAVILRVTIRTVYRWLHSGRLPAVRAGGRRWLITERNISDFLAAPRQPSTAAAPGDVPARPSSAPGPTPSPASGVDLGVYSVPSAAAELLAGKTPTPLANQKNRQKRR